MADLPTWASEALALGVKLPATLTNMDIENFRRAKEHARYELIQRVPQARNDLKAGRIWLALITRDEILNYREFRDQAIALRKKTSLGKSYVVEAPDPIPPFETVS